MTTKVKKNREYALNLHFNVSFSHLKEIAWGRKIMSRVLKTTKMRCKDDLNYEKKHKLLQENVI